MTTIDKSLELSLIPGHEEECKKVWETQVLLLGFLNTQNICFVGPYRPTLDYEAISSWFLTYEDEHPIIHKDIIRSDFLKETSGIFRVSPPKDRKTFFNWLAHVEANKSPHQKNIGIYDLIQLSKYGIFSLYMHMLMASFLFWNWSLHSLKLPYDPITLTLMDIATITDPKPFSKTYAFILIEDQIERSEVDIDFSAKSYGAFIEKNVQDIEVVSDEEHIAFLVYWVSSHLLCTHSLQIPMCSYNLAQDLHFREDICLSKFLLTFVYKVIDEAVKIMDTPDKMKHIVGLLWIVQSWFIAIL